MSEKDDILDDLNNLDKPTSLSLEELKKRRARAKYVYNILIGAGCIILFMIIRNSRPKHQNIDMDRLNKTIKAVQTLKRIDFDTAEVARQRRAMDNILNSSTVRRFNRGK